MSGTVDHDALAAKVASSMPQLRDDLARLVAIPSVSVLGFPAETHAALLEARDTVSELLRNAGVERLEMLELPDTAPVIMGEIPAPEGAPTVLLYGHYDVVPIGDESKWGSPPFEATERDGAIYGRGAADSKSNILMHVGALRAWDGRPPVGIKVVVEGQEETGSAFTTYPPTRPELFAADAMVIGDMGSIRPGVPTLTIGLRGMAVVSVEVRTLAGPKHSGQFGGAAPDALLALKEPAEAQAALVKHLESIRPFGIELEVSAAETGKGFFADTSGPAYDAARVALANAWGAESVYVATGGSIPLVSALSEAAPDAEILLFGTTDGFANIHAPNERVLLDEFEKAVVAEAELFGLYADAFSGRATSSAS